ncbi:MAG: sigma 54-interacting transcriptional regulator [Thermodesulfobacteriota bacterium]
MSLDVQLQESMEEVDRLGRNWQSLLEVMPEMVVLVGGDHQIHYLNSSARLAFGDLQGMRCTDNLCNSDERCRLLCPMRSFASGGHGKPSLLVETHIGDYDVEYSCVPFHGYKGDDMFMFVFRDVSERKEHEKEIQSFHQNIETILQEKIKELGESERTRRRLMQEVNVLKRKTANQAHPDKMIGNSRKMNDLREMIYRVADSDATILITGESGTGKELVADLVQSSSQRSDKPFLKVNCSAINDQLLESELFGHERGAFTGATARKKGKFEVNNHGTIFLDEIGDISPRMQAALLRVLQNKELVRVGGTEPIRVDVRVIAATNVDLLKAVEEGGFRLDLYYRLNTFILDIPPLRERKEDIVALASHFVRKYREAFKRQVDHLPNSIVDMLIMHSWPGNVRDLENVIQRAVLLAKDNVISEGDIVFDSGVDVGLAPEETGLEQIMAQADGEGLKAMLAAVERGIISRALQSSGGNVQGVAKGLKVGKTALYDKIKRYGINPKAMK